jgi:hypothetical protein
MAAMTHYAAEYSNRGWTAVVTVDPVFIRVVAVPAGGMDPKAYVLGLLKKSVSRRRVTDSGSSGRHDR